MWIISLFALLIVKTIYQSENWQSYYFHDASVFSDRCSLRATGGPTLQRPTALDAVPFTKIPKVPQARGALSDFVKGDYPFYHVDYLCTVDLLSYVRSPGLTYAHLGWVFGDEVAILVNGHQRLTANGSDKFSLPLLPEDLAGSNLTFEVRARGENLNRLGLVGGQMPAIASGTATNLAIFGVDAALENGINLGKLLPLLTLGMILAIAWLAGISTLVLLAGFFYFVLSSTALLLWVSVSLLPFEATRTYLIGMPLQIGGGFGALLVGMEILGVGKKKIYPLMLADFVLAVAGAVAIAAAPTVFAFSRQVATTSSAIFAILGSSLIYLAWRQGSFAKTSRTSSANRMMAGVLIFFSVANGIDFFGRVTGGNLFVATYLDLLLPFALATTILQFLRNAEDRYREAAETGAELEAKLAAGPAVQALLLPARERVRTDRLAFESKKNLTQMDGAWLIHWEDGQGQFHLMQGQVVGEGLKATVASASVLAIINTLKYELLPMSTTVERLHLTLGELYSHYVTTSLFACVVFSDGAIEVHNHGEPRSLQVSGIDVRVVALKAHFLIGSKIALKAAPQSLRLASDEGLSLNDPELSSDVSSWTIRTV